MLVAFPLYRAGAGFDCGPPSRFRADNDTAPVVTTVSRSSSNHAVSPVLPSFAGAETQHWRHPVM